jgi:hypothetical protein
MADLYREKPDGLPTQEKTNGGVIQGETTHTLRIVLVNIGEGQLHYQTHL